MRLLLLIGLLGIGAIVKAQTFAIKADRLIDGKSDKEFLNPIIIIYKTRIVDINFKNHIPDSAQIIDLKGYTVLPGLIDAHTHLLLDLHKSGDYEIELYQKSTPYRAIRAVSFLSAALQRGFTTIRDLCTEGAGYSDVDLSKLVDDGTITGPRIIPSTKGIAATGRYVPRMQNQNWELELPTGAEYVTGVEECRKAVREQISKGAQCIKVFVDWGFPSYKATISFTIDELRAITDEAKRYNIPLAAHAQSAEGISLAIKLGFNSIEHGAGFNEILIKDAVENSTFWCPTLSAFEYNHYENLNGFYQIINKAYKAGLKIVLGSDIGSFPWTINQAREVKLLVDKGGLKPIDAIKSSTYYAAELLGLKAELGSIEKNYRADIIAIKGNPLVDISILEKVDFVMKDGKIYKRP